MHPALTIGLVAAAIYAAIAVVIVLCERRSTHGGWISLPGLVSYLTTFPVAVLAEQLGHKLDFRRNLEMALAIVGTAACVALAIALVAWPFTLLASL